MCHPFGARGPLTLSYDTLLNTVLPQQTTSPVPLTHLVIVFSELHTGMTGISDRIMQVHNNKENQVVISADLSIIG